MESAAVRNFGHGFRIFGFVEKVYNPRMTLPNHPRISIDPEICGGRPTIAGTRMRVTDILEALAEGVSEEELVADFPYVTREDIRACLTYAAFLSEEPRRYAAG